jgi:acetyltransferase-like isoleucine patch superfamily enzyme
MTMKLDHDWFPKEVPGNVQLGERSWLYSSFAFEHYKSNQLQAVKVGNDSGLYNGTFFDLGPEGKVEIGNFCALVGVIISSNNFVKIGDYSFIAHEVVIADSFAAVPGIEDKDYDKKDIIIGRNVWIGANAILLGGAKIGEGSIVGAAAVVDFEVPPFSIVAGNPAKIKGQIKL